MVHFRSFPILAREIEGSIKTIHDSHSCYWINPNLKISLSRFKSKYFVLFWMIFYFIFNSASIFNSEPSIERHNGHNGHNGHYQSIHRLPSTTPWSIHAPIHCTYSPLQIIHTIWALRNIQLWFLNHISLNKRHISTTCLYPTHLYWFCNPTRSLSNKYFLMK